MSLPSRALLLVAAATALLAQLCRASLVAAAIFPHGDIAWRPEGKGLNATQLDQAKALQAAAYKAGCQVAAAAPDLVLLTTPHGIADLDAFAFFLNLAAAGCMPSNRPAHGDLHQFLEQAPASRSAAPPSCVSISVDFNVTMALLKYLQDRTFKRTIGLSGFGPPGEAGMQFPLGWGEVIPISFLPDELRSAATFILLSMPSRRYTEAARMVPEMIDLGGALFDFLEGLPQRVALVVSGDLAHTHAADGPYGFSEDAAPFDAAIGNWVESLESRFLLEEARRHADGAKSCGFTGFALLHGILARAATSQAARRSSLELETSTGGTSGSGSGNCKLWGGLGDSGPSSIRCIGANNGVGLEDYWRSQLLAMHHPTYYGMAVATMQRTSAAQHH